MLLRICGTLACVTDCPRAASECSPLRVCIDSLLIFSKVKVKPAIPYQFGCVGVAGEAGSGDMYLYIYVLCILGLSSANRRL